MVAPPSVHPDGHVYRWSNDVPIAAAPDWLVVLTRKRPTITERALATMRVPLQYGGIARRLRQGRARIRDRSACQYAERPTQPRA